VSLELTLWDLPAEYARPLLSRTMFGSIVLQEAQLFGLGVLRRTQDSKGITAHNRVGSQDT
ncbi:MAG: hypothetical protein OXM02_02710, partial [Bacteroidota bacterium]|nr:hypothetical protein [Bacteroidota bacterium]